jgi:hypothetical protein
MCVLTSPNSEPWSGRSCVIDQHVSIRRDWYELRGMVGGCKCRWVNLGCQPKYCSSHQRIATALRKSFTRRAELERAELEKEQGFG